MSINSAAKLKELLQHNDNVVVKFGAKWCGPCKRVRGVYNDLADEYKDNCYFADVDIDDCRELAEEYDIDSIPAFIFLKKGQLIDKFVGSDPHKLQKHVDNLLKI